MDSNLVPFNVTADYGDVVPPSPPSQFDDEFEGPDIANKWTISTVNADRMVRIQEPTYLQMRANFGGSGITNLWATQRITSPTNFLWQTKVRFLLLPFETSRDVIGKIVYSFWVTSPARYFSVTLRCYSHYDQNIGGFSYPLEIWCSRNQDTDNGISASFKIGQITGLDMRLQVGVFNVGSGQPQLQARMSNDGWNWLVIWTENFNGVGTSFNNVPPDNVSLRLESWTESGGGSAAAYSNLAMIAAWDYFRDYSRDNI